MPYGHDQSAWDEAKREAKEIISTHARVKDVIAYSDLAAQITSINFEPQTMPFFHFLGEISVEEDAAGRGLMTALVVHKAGDYKPGPGFFELAKEHGRDVSDLDRCWTQEVARVYSAWCG